ncbi:T9SS type A sorting domain-containing protein [Epilithonimonas sp.]|uniref:T9SS type A sorting domain-containing protein n=1 Tax=Epilithonimonas sp. TaxID=2894511 RepID=UPI0028983D9E|nr:T9SS type A sorting domain-containing protein [Epilithonimonas sp.]
MKKIYLLSACLFLGSLNAQTNLRVLTGWGTRLYDINNNGVGVHPGGYYDYSTDTSTSIEPEARSTNKINNDGNVSGTMPFTATDGSNLDQAAYRKNGTWNTIGYFPGDVPGNSWFSNANAISGNSKYITGQTSVGASGSYPYVYNTETNTLTKLTDGDNLWEYGRGQGINDAGYVSGFVDREDIFNMGTFWVPAYFDPTGTLHYIDFDVPEAGEAADINNAGQIVGYKGDKAFIYDINTNTYKSFGSTDKISNPVFSSISENGLAIGYCGALGNRDVIVYHSGMTEPILLTEYLKLKGVDITTFDGKLGTGMGVSADGKYICGFDNTAPVLFAAGWVVHLDEFPHAAGCLSSPNGINPTTIYSPACDGTTETITTSAKTGEYSFVQLTAGKQYTFSSSVSTDFITIANETGTNIIKYGTGNVTIIATENQTVRFHLNLADNCSYSSDTRSKYISCTTPTGCQWTVHVFDFLGFGDEVSWTLKNSTGETLLSGGGYGAGYDDTKTLFADGPLTFYIESMGTFGDNTPSYTISNSTTELASGSLSPEAGQEATHSDLNCATMAVTESNKSTLRYYPNPIKDILKISSEKNIKSLAVYSLDGKLVMNNLSFNNKSGDINLSTLKTGNYIISVIFSDESAQSFKVIKE